MQLSGRIAGPPPNSLQSNLSRIVETERSGSSRANFPNVCKKVSYFIFYFIVLWEDFLFWNSHKCCCEEG